MALYAERLAATLPAPLKVCYFVNSASEANELALRMARTFTGRRDMIALEGAYHGHTNALVDLSPYKHAGPGGSGAPDWVHVAPCPDDYRGLFKRDDPLAGARYAAQVAAIIESLKSRNRGLAGFIAETCPSVGGQIMLPAGYLSQVYRHVRTAGGVCIADEVQTGLGRIGTHFWAFEAHGVVPDMVVMGKPLGNGHPMAAVVTTRAIADAFDNGMEFFSTFGGNNVSCAVGLAVLDVMRDEQLQDHARTVGNRMLDALKPFVGRYPIVGDVRGSGLVPWRGTGARSRDAGACRRGGIVRREPDARRGHPARHRRPLPQRGEDPAADAILRARRRPARRDVRANRRSRTGALTALRQVRSYAKRRMRSVVAQLTHSSVMLTPYCRSALFDGTGCLPSFR